MCGHRLIRGDVVGTDLNAIWNTWSAARTSVTHLHQQHTKCLVWQVAPPCFPISDMIQLFSPEVWLGLCKVICTKASNGMAITSKSSSDISCDSPEVRWAFVVFHENSLWVISRMEEDKLRQQVSGDLRHQPAALLHVRSQMDADPMGPKATRDGDSINADLKWHHRCRFVHWKLDLLVPEFSS